LKIAMLILHGANILASRKVLIEQKGTAKAKEIEVIDLEGKELDLTKLTQALESASLFGQDRLVVIESFFSLPKSKNKEEILDYLKTQLGANLIIWEGRKIDGRILKSFAGKAKIQEFKLPVVIFKFLESLQPGQPRLSLELLHQTLKTEPPELAFYMIARQVRYLLIAKDLGNKGLSGFAPWQQARYLRQAEKFSFDQLLKLHRNLLQIDWEQKTGRAAFPLKSALDLLVLNL
jgi:DNA polymerase III delta subunit